jgi:uncharacterized FlgJ-related protein
MKTKTVSAIVTSLMLAAAAATVRAQAPAAKTSDDDKLIELVRKDVRAGKADIIAKTMNFDAAQAAAFWPVYKAYEAERQALGNERLGVIQDLAEHFETLNDAKAKGLLDRSLAIEEKRVALEKRYAGEFLKVLPAKTVARFFQVESRLNNLINLELSSQIPLVN